MFEVVHKANERKAVDIVHLQWHNFSQTLHTSVLSEEPADTSDRFRIEHKVSSTGVKHCESLNSSSTSSLHLEQRENLHLHRKSGVGQYPGPALPL